MGLEKKAGIARETRLVKLSRSAVHRYWLRPCLYRKDKREEKTFRAPESRAHSARAFGWGGKCSFSYDVVDCLFDPAKFK